MEFEAGKIRQVFEKSSDLCYENRTGTVRPTPLQALTKPTFKEVKMAIPTQARVKEYFNYDPVTGDLLFKERPREDFSAPRYADHLRRVGSVAGTIESQGYRHVLIDGAVHKAHRIIWLMVYGEWVEYPAFEIDHINGQRADNRLSNLRKVTKSANQRNSGRRVTNTSGVHGVNLKEGRWGRTAFLARLRPTRV